MEMTSTAIDGCFQIQARVLRDERGSFVKTYLDSVVRDRGLRTDWKEEYYTSSALNVIRGMHLQVPPAHHAKMVVCVAGSVLDVVLDLRRGSPSEGQSLSFELSHDNGVGLYIPSGCAHGFLSLEDVSTMYYKVTSVHSPQHDVGLAWDSFGFDWGVDDPVISARDRKHPGLEEFDSPFRYDPASACL